MAFTLSDGTLRRIAWIQAVIVVAGLIVWGLAKGRLGLLSFTFGALVSTACFWLLSRAVSAVSGSRLSMATAITSALRLLIAGFVIRAILSTYEVLPAAVVTGIATPVVAITLDVVYELLYARTP